MIANVNGRAKHYDADLLQNRSLRNVKISVGGNATNIEFFFGNRYDLGKTLEVIVAKEL